MEHAKSNYEEEHDVFGGGEPGPARQASRTDAAGVQSSGTGELLIPSDAADLHDLSRSSARSRRMLGQSGTPGCGQRAQVPHETIGAVMGLSWQQGPLGQDPNGTFLTATPMPERVLYLEPLRRRMSVELGGSIIARSDEAVILFEPGRYPVAYLPIGDIEPNVLQLSDHETAHPDLGKTRWFNVIGGDGETTRRGAWEHVEPPAQAGALRDTVAFAWRTMDAFYEEDERILGHAADPYHRIDIRRTSRHLVAREGDRVVADTHAPLVLYESGFAPRWYVPRADIDGDALHAVEGQTFCPYKGLASYYLLRHRRRAQCRMVIPRALRRGSSHHRSRIVPSGQGDGHD